MPIPDEDDENTEFRQKFEVTILLSLCANLLSLCVSLEKLFFKSNHYFRSIILSLLTR